MNRTLLLDAARIVLYLHFAVVLFNIFWLIAVPIGAWRGWKFVLSFWWRAAHLISLLIVALQAIAGNLCFLTVFQYDLGSAAGGSAEPQSLIDLIVTRAVFWPLPMWAFVVLYTVAFVYAAALWWIVPPRSSCPS